LADRLKLGLVGFGELIASVQLALQRQDALVGVGVREPGLGLDVAYALPVVEPRRRAARALGRTVDREAVPAHDASIPDVDMHVRRRARAPVFPVQLGLGVAPDMTGVRPDIAAVLL